MSLEKKTAIVTGGSRGIGLATSKALALEGARVFAIARGASIDEDQAENITLLTTDVRNWAQVQECVKHVRKDTGNIDILVNNAGVEIIKPLADTTEEDYDKVLDTNLKGAFLFTSAVLPAMQAQRSGHLIYVNSVCGLRGYAEDAIYCASKYGLAGLADALDEELRLDGIRVTSIHPGATDTALSIETWAPPDDPHRPYFLDPEDVARAVVFVASQPAHVVVSQVVLRPLIEPPYSDIYSPERLRGLLDDR